MARVNGQDLSISPRFSPYDFLSRCDFSTLPTLRQLDYWFNFTYSRSHAFHYGCQSKRNRPVKNRTNEPALLPMRVYPLQHTPLGRRLPSLALVRFLTGLFFCSDFVSGKSEKGVSTYELYRSLMLFSPRSRLRIWCRDTDSVVPSRVSPLIFHTQAGSRAYSRGYSRFPRRRPFNHFNSHTPSGQSRVIKSPSWIPMAFTPESPPAQD